MNKLLCLVVLGVLLGCCEAHMSIWVPSMWGADSNPTTSWMAQPLQDQNFSGWWMHGTQTLNIPPAANAVTVLPAGGSIDLEITGNKWCTSMQNGLCSPNAGQSPRNPPVPWDNGMNDRCSANIHAPARQDVAGCALGITYKSNIRSVNPADFVIFSVAHDCIARTLQNFDIPALPACPNNMCICSWFWIHKSIGGTDQMYMTPFQCTVSNPSNLKLGTPSAPVRCDGQPPYKGGPVTTTCKKVQNPMYWANKEGNNMANPVNTQSAPTYSDAYGFPDGAQHSIFTALPTVTNSIGDTLFSNGVNSISSNPFSILVSPSRTTGVKLTIQGDGNLVLYDVATGAAKWSSNTAGVAGVAPYRLLLKADGNLVVVDSQNTQFWQSNTANSGCAPYKLKVRDVRTLKIVDCNETPVWSVTI